MIGAAPGIRIATRFVAAVVVAIVAVSALGVAPGAAAPRAAEGTHLIEALEGARLVVVGTVRRPMALDAHGWRATLQVETVVEGPARPGDVVVFAWEELSSARALRFQDGERVLLALEPLTGASLWRSRFPDTAEAARVHLVAARGDAFLRRPSLGSVDVLTHLLALVPADRRGGAGRLQLLALIAEAESALAQSAAAALPALATHGALAPGEAQLVVRGLGRGDPELASRLLTWIEARRPEGLLAALDAAAGAGAAEPAPAIAARGILGGLPGARVQWLLAHGAPDARAAAARHAGSQVAPALASCVRADPAPPVRVACVERLVELEGVAALEPAVEALGDPEMAVRRGAAAALAGLGAAAVPRLRDVALGWAPPARETAVLALGLTGGPEARTALQELAQSSDPAVRGLARVALGQSFEEEH